MYNNKILIAIDTSSINLILITFKILKIKIIINLTIINNCLFYEN